MEFILANQRKGTLEQQLQSYEIIKVEKTLLKLNQEREDARYWVLKKQANDLEINFTILQWDKDGLQGQVQV